MAQWGTGTPAVAFRPCQVSFADAAPPPPPPCCWPRRVAGCSDDADELRRSEPTSARAAPRARRRRPPSPSSTADTGAEAAEGAARQGHRSRASEAFAEFVIDRWGYALQHQRRHGAHRPEPEGRSVRGLPRAGGGAEEAQEGRVVRRLPGREGRQAQGRSGRRSRVSRWRRRRSTSRPRRRTSRTASCATRTRPTRARRSRCGCGSTGSATCCWRSVSPDAWTSADGRAEQPALVGSGLVGAGRVDGTGHRRLRPRRRRSTSPGLPDDRRGARPRRRCVAALRDEQAVLRPAWPGAAAAPASCAASSGAHRRRARGARRAAQRGRRGRRAPARSRRTPTGARRPARRRVAELVRLEHALADRHVATAMECRSGALARVVAVDVGRRGPAGGRRWRRSPARRRRLTA